MSLVFRSKGRAGQVSAHDFVTLQCVNEHYYWEVLLPLSSRGRAGYQIGLLAGSAGAKIATLGHSAGGESRAFIIARRLITKSQEERLALRPLGRDKKEDEEALRPQRG